MGQMFLYDLFGAHRNVENFSLFTLDDVDRTFELFRQLKYSEAVELSGVGTGIQVVPHEAGHLIGGTIWRILKDTDSIVYAVDYNNRKEQLLNSSLLEAIERPTVLITDAYNGLVNQLPKRSALETQLCEHILSSVRQDGCVLIPVDAAGRALELLLVLNAVWRDPRFSNYTLAFLSNVAYNTIEFAKGMLEWTSEALLKQFDSSEKRKNPLHFEKVQICHTMAELAELKSPKVVLASCASLDYGFSRELFLEWSKNPSNKVILTERGQKNSLTRTLVEGITTQTLPSTLSLLVKKRIELSGHELQVYNAKKEKEREEKERKARELSRKRKRDAASAAEDRAAGKAPRMFSEESDEDDDDDQDTLVQKIDSNSASVSSPMSDISSPKLSSLNTHADQLPTLSLEPSTTTGPSVTPTVATQTPALPGSQAPNLESVLIPEELMMEHDFSKKIKFPMFPFVEIKKEYDEYGEMFDPQDYFFAPALATMGVDQFSASLLPSLSQAAAASEPTNKEQEKPTKCVQETKEISLACSCVFLEMDGRVDAMSTKKIIAQYVRPQQLVLIHGVPAARENLRAHFSAIAQQLFAERQSEQPTSEISPQSVFAVHAPENGFKLNLTVDSHVFKIKLDESLLKQLEFKKAGNYSLAWVEGKVALGAQATDGSGVTILGKRRADAMMPVLMPRESVDPRVNRTFIGQFRLDQFTQFLKSQGYRVDLSDGVLYCNKTIRVRRVKDSNQLIVEGPLSKDYFQIRKLLYTQFAVL
eukprot:TRINITY_DN4858_c0_g1_i1.p1 TRINITY_DN4858_c0_g1~~TRINITY_DN4858_c0_g1_i1.p1  ORF type:complete len:857 (-),score=236.55 TRINITY_DN4858_c0_g1_i1:60-2339(-)